MMTTHAQQSARAYANSDHYRHIARLNPPANTNCHGHAAQHRDFWTGIAAAVVIAMNVVLIFGPAVRAAWGAL